MRWRVERNLGIETACYTYRGRREVNQDRVYARVWRPREPSYPRALFAVADGMGGGQYGEVASKVTIDLLARALLPASRFSLGGLARDLLAQALLHAPRPATAEPREWLREAYHSAHQVVRNQVWKRGGVIGTTLACVVIVADGFLVGNVGDSRVYHWHEGHLQQITVDHTLAEAGGHLSQAALTRSLGGDREPEVDLFPQMDSAMPQALYLLAPEDLLLLCSDGLYKAVDVEQMGKVLREVSPLQVPERLGRLTYCQGSDDNISVVVASFGSPGNRLSASRQGVTGTGWRGYLPCC